MTPHNLAREAPVLDVFQPVGVNLFPAIREEADDLFAHDAERFLDHHPAEHLLVIEEPLVGETRFDRHLPALAEADVVVVRLGLHQLAHGLEHFGGLLARLETVESVESPARPGS